MSEEKDFFEEAIEQDLTENPVKEGIKDGFQSKVTAARELLEKKGEWAGLCRQCYNTNHVFVEIDGYQAIEYSQESRDTPIMLTRCSHGKDVSEGYNY